MHNLARAITTDGGVICVAINSTSIAARSETIHATSAVVSAGLGRLLTAASMMGSMMKEESHTVTLRINGGGDVGSLIAVADGRANVRGYPTNPVVELPLNAHGKLDVAGAVGKDGFLAVIKDVGLDEPMSGYSPIVSGEIAEDITYYYATSEQIPTVCSLGVLVAPDLRVQAAGGFLIQLLPGAEESTITRIEQNIEAMPAISTLIDGGATPMDVIKACLDGFDFDILDTRQADYVCNCSRDRVEKALISLGAEELLVMADDQETTEVSCHFCPKKYRFSSEELKLLAKSQKSSL
jgi:molecular chaperone Hsp33